MAAGGEVPQPLNAVELEQLGSEVRGKLYRVSDGVMVVSQSVLDTYGEELIKTLVGSDDIKVYSIEELAASSEAEREADE